MHLHNNHVDLYGEILRDDNLFNFYIDWLNRRMSFQMTYRYTRHNLRTNSLSYEELAHDLRNLAHFSRTEQLRQRIFLSENRYQHLIHFFSVDLIDTLEQGDLMIINQSTINMFSDPLTLINSL